MGARGEPIRRLLALRDAARNRLTRAQEEAAYRGLTPKQNHLLSILKEGMSQEELAELLHVGRPRISKLINGILADLPGLYAIAKSQPNDIYNT